MKKIIFLLLFFPAFLAAQQTDERRAIDQRIYPQGDVQSYDLRKRTKIKRFYLDENWQEGTFLFKDGERSNRSFFIRYDILNQNLVARLKDSEFIIPMDSLQGFFVKNAADSLNVPERKFTVLQENESAHSDIYEVVVEGRFQLWINHYAEKLKANYNPALDTGSLNEKILKKEAFFLMDDQGRLIEIPNKKKQAIQVFQEYPEAKTYLASNKVNFKNVNSLKKLVLFINNNQKK